jgi:hypothetical protein
MNVRRAPSTPRIANGKQPCMPDTVIVLHADAHTALTGHDWTPLTAPQISALLLEIFNTTPMTPICELDCKIERRRTKSSAQAETDLMSLCQSPLSAVLND